MLPVVGCDLSVQAGANVVETTDIQTGNGSENENERGKGIEVDALGIGRLHDVVTRGLGQDLARDLESGDVLTTADECLMIETMTAVAASADGLAPVHQSGPLSAPRQLFETIHQDQNR